MLLIAVFLDQYNTTILILRLDSRNQNMLRKHNTLHRNNLFFALSFSGVRIYPEVCQCTVKSALGVISGSAEDTVDTHCEDLLLFNCILF